MTDFPTFAQFYAAVHSRDPFPWQSRLAEQVTKEGWPTDIGVPTGLGKTASIDIAVWSLAAQHDFEPHERWQPRRIWYVVDRRLLVDAASDHAIRLADLLAEPKDPTIAAVAEGLRALCATDTARPLHVWRLRGGDTSAGSPGGRPPDPSIPTVICSTVAMYGSRLLFRGYGSSRSLRPIDAAHAGTDALVLLDEAHLARPLQRMVGLLPGCDANQTGVLRWPGRFEKTRGPLSLLPETRAYPKLVNLTATGNANAFTIDSDDRANPVVAERLAAHKPTRLVETTRAHLAKTMVSALLDALGGQSESGPAAVVFVNSPATARQVAQEIANRSNLDPIVLTGQLRDPDAHRIRTRLLDPHAGAAAGTSPVRQHPLVVIATQTLEVGADLDFDICVSENAGIRAIVQRWGRLNRLGLKPHATATLAHASDMPDDGLYGDEPHTLWRRLQELEQPVDLGPAHVNIRLGEPGDVPGRVGELLPAHLWEFAKSSTPPPGQAPPEVFFDELEEPNRRVGVLWRAVLPVPGQPLTPPPADGEIVEVPIGEMRQFLADLVDADLPQVISDDGITTDSLDPVKLRPGQRIILPATAGGYTRTGWNPDATADVRDLSPQLRTTIHLNAKAIDNLLGHPSTTEIRALIKELGFDQQEGPDLTSDAALVSRFAEALAESLPSLTKGRNARIERVGELLTPVLRWQPERPTAPARVDSLDELSNAPRVGLAEHCASVGELAARVATSLGLPSDMVEVLQQAGDFHDLGKADQRFQRWLGNVNNQAPIAKSAMAPAAWRRAASMAGWPLGGRHELLSAQLISALAETGHPIVAAELTRHLVLTHHGHGRPLVPVTATGDPLTTSIVINGTTVTTQTDTSNADWDQPSRFQELCETYGYWGLALLETCLRQADHRVSADTIIEVI